MEFSCTNDNKMTSRWTHRKRRYPADDQFFEQGNLWCNMIIKRVPQHEQEDLLKRIDEFVCNVSGCNQVFTTLHSFETHYNSSHRHVCSECHRKFPSNHLLEIHILEWHDIMFQLLAEKQNMFHCLVQECTETFSNPKERKDHLIKVHKYPASFRFHRNRTHKTDLSEKMETQDEGAEKTKKFSYKVPTNICFGHGVARGFQRPRGKKKKRKDWHQGSQSRHTKMDIEKVDMGELATALEQDPPSMDVDAKSLIS